MKQIAIFTAPKPFNNDHINIIQRNAISSWRDMGASVDIMLMGREKGIGRAAKELGVRHIPDVRLNEEGTPLVSSLFELAREASEAPILAYVNADIILFPETLSIVQNISEKSKRFVLLGQRTDLDITEAIDFSISWPDDLHKAIDNEGRLHPLGGSDYFIFPRELYTEIPDFAIGRAGWDNWMIYHAVSAPWPAIDLSEYLTVIHQNHDYAHLPGGEAHYRGAETETNAHLAGGMRKLYNLLDVKYEFRKGRIRKKRLSAAQWIRGFERRLQPNDRVGKGLRWVLLRRLRKLRRALVRS